jgi:NAD(P)-dependent dehydrogenase (short-subunit alcohol dehydrogenase family)
MLLADKVCVITGAASPRGIGLATARLFAKHGGRAVILDLDDGQAKVAARELGEGHLGLACDVTNKPACLSAADQIIREFGRIDVLVNNAGITQPLKIMEIEPKNYDAVLDVNLRGTLYMSQAVIPQMREQKSGSIVCMSSVSAQRGGGIFGGPHYSGAKGGVLGLAKAMARELGPDNVRVNSVTPGLIQTDITGGKLTDELKVEISRGIPLGRLGVADDVANACLFLASDLSSYITGAVIDVNGGMLIH